MYYSALLHTHSYVRYLVFAALLVVIIVSLLGLLGKKPFTKTNNLLSLILLISAHTQAAIGLLLYFTSPFVQFGSQTMKDKATRYWTVEHIFAMIIAVVLITAARSTMKKMSNDQAKHKRLFIFNLIALVIVVTVVYLSGRGIF